MILPVTAAVGVGDIRRPIDTYVWTYKRFSLEYEATGMQPATVKVIQAWFPGVVSCRAACNVRAPSWDF